MYSELIRVIDKVLFFKCIWHCAEVSIFIAHCVTKMLFCCLFYRSCVFNYRFAVSFDGFIVFNLPQNVTINFNVYQLNKCQIL